MKCVDDFRLRLGSTELVPIVIGGMGVDISTPQLALTAVRMGGIGHLSDAMMMATADHYFRKHFSRDKMRANMATMGKMDKSSVHFDLGALAEATRLHVSSAMEAKRGHGLLFINLMEKLTMNAPRETMQTRMTAALDAGIDGITLAAGLNQSSFHLIQDHPRFRDAKMGIIVSSARALQIFIRRNAKLNRLPDYVIVEGPLAGGHLGFGMDWAKFDLKTIVAEVQAYLKKENLDIPLIAAGGVFTGSDAVGFLENGAAAVQVATRFTVSRECGLPEAAKQAYLNAAEDDIEVNMQSPTGYPMRMLKNTPAVGQGIRPNCEIYGYILENGKCEYIDAYEREIKLHPEKDKLSVKEKVCLCTHMRNYDVWTCGHNTYRLKDTTRRLEDGSYLLPSAEHIFRDYQFSKGHEILLPE
ncbi:nitronate monooxygenase [Oxalobacter vibrioformis]|uniref:Nitronate monooxygenase n=1 Tax=Oxalobacter vibrioformis TaxID=933080 RepID=A0A9E9LXX5_9BURK|nr:nitronate monooxygenase [Oxalobacter vibrioformis]WAW09459.1 nitronate monooxygenase [Oxalobacter vibrioformis]